MDETQWNDWRWQYRNRITDVKGLSTILDLSEQEKNDIAACLQKFRMAITPYFASLIDPADPCDPIRMQAVPSVSERRVFPWESFPWEGADPLNEEKQSPVPNIVHRYPDRVLFTVTKCCAMYCRHCTRRRLVGEEDYAISNAEIETAVDYIRKTRAVRDVLVSGGDPLTLSDDRLEYIISQLRGIDQVEVIRIGTRVPCTLPMRITPALLSMLKRYQPVWINTHFNHPKELTDAALNACAMIIDAGIPLGNQSVLLRGINDTTAVMKDLLLKLVKARIRPYYLYQCDLSEGLEHFRTDVRTGINIIRELTGYISGYAVPKFVIDAPGGGGKVPMNPDYVVSIDDRKVVMKNYQGKLYEYPQPAQKCNSPVVFAKNGAASSRAALSV
jgi:lysine 2,3-aminomutase